MFRPLFVVIARVVSRDQALPKWRERLQGLCQVSKQEPYSHSYYWGYDLDGEPDTIWGLEGYHHPVGFFMNHVSSDTFKEEMRKVDQDNLLRHEQGLASPDYDLHHYDLFAGFAKRENDKGPDDEDSFVAVVHFWALDGRRKQILGTLADVLDRVKASSQRPLTLLQSFMVLKEPHRDCDRRRDAGKHQTPPWSRDYTSYAPAIAGTIGIICAVRQ
ncbi:hypothetical protein SCUP515_10239 [Seiridium cupressi]